MNGAASADDEIGFGPWAFAWLITLMVLLIGSLVASQSQGWLGALGVGGLIFLSSTMVGALLGFIFAVPRVIARDGKISAEEQGISDKRAKLLDTNTNLERISDWLTTMLVGVGLSQLTNLNSLFLEFRNFLAETATVYTVNGHPSAGILPAIGPLVLVLGTALGFLFMYLLTRLVLVGFFRESEEKTLSPVAADAVRLALANAQAEIGSQPAAGLPLQGTDGGPKRADKAKAGAPDLLVRPTFADPTLTRALRAATLSTDDALAVMFRLLYQPGGYRGVIQMSGELSNSPVAKRAEYWFYLAAAFGQQMQSATNDEERESARDNALDAAGRAVAIDKSYRDRLWLISSPRGPDDDLKLLRNDEQFRKLVGKE